MTIEDKIEYLVKQLGVCSKEFKDGFKQGLRIAFNINKNE